MRHKVRPPSAIFTEEDSLFETIMDLGEKVEEGIVLACIHPIGHDGLAPRDIRARMSGIPVARHVPGLIKADDCTSVLAQ